MQIQPRKHVLHHAEYTAPPVQRELHRTDQYCICSKRSRSWTVVGTYHADHTDHTNHADHLSDVWTFHNQRRSRFWDKILEIIDLVLSKWKRVNPLKHFQHYMRCRCFFTRHLFLLVIFCDWHTSAQCWMTSIITAALEDILFLMSDWSMYWSMYDALLEGKIHLIT